VYLKYNIFCENYYILLKKGRKYPSKWFAPKNGREARRKSWERVFYQVIYYLSLLYWLLFVLYKDTRKEKSNLQISNKKII
jgi:hypothetical protein